MKLLLVNTVATGGSIPAYMRTIAREALSRGYDVTMAYGRGLPMPGVRNIRIGNALDHAAHGIATRLFDRHGLASRASTRRFTAEAERLQPDIIHLHNIHGYYLHYPTLFAWLKKYGRPVLWSMHDCWAFTGHCAFFDSRECSCLRWHTGCGECPQLRQYPASLGADRSAVNFKDKNLTFNQIPPLLRILPVSDWLSERLADSCLAGIARTTVKIDLDTDIFRPSGTPRTPRVLGVANVWDARKGLDFFARLRQELPDSVEIRLAGRIPGKVPKGIKSLGNIADRRELAREYSEATVTVSASYAENYPQTIREALACGCAVSARDTGGTLEGLIGTGLPVWSGTDDDSLVKAVKSALAAPAHNRWECASRFAGTPNLDILFGLYTELSIRNC